MPNTYTLIASNTVGSGGVSTVTFSSIPSTYTDLLVKASARQSGGSGVMNLQFNSSSADYSYRTVFGNGSTAGSQSVSGTSVIGPGSNAGNVNWSSTTASTFSNFEMYIPNYASSNFKSASIDAVVENNASTGYDLLEAALWSNTAAITSILFDPSGSETFDQYSSFYLYGIKNS